MADFLKRSQIACADFTAGSETLGSPMTNTDFSEQWKSMQKMFLFSFPHSESFQENARRFWENQDKILNNMEAFTSNWFERRHVGTNSGQEAAQRMCGTESMVDVVRAYQDWAKGAFERMMGRWNCLPGTNRGSDRRARLAADITIGKGK
jgi:hypothetical protein